MADATQVIDSSVNRLAQGDCLRQSGESLIARFRVVMLIGSGLDGDDVHRRTVHEVLVIVERERYADKLAGGVGSGAAAGWTAG